MPGLSSVYCAVFIYGLLLVLVLLKFGFGQDKSSCVMPARFRVYTAMPKLILELVLLYQFLAILVVRVATKPLLHLRSQDAAVSYKLCYQSLCIHT